MATLVHASVIHQPTRPWTPLRIGVVWALATCAGPLAGAGSVLVWLRLFPPDIDNEGAAIFFGLVLILAMGVLALIGMAVAQAATLAWMRGTVGWQGKIAGAWVAATLGGAVAGVVLGGLMDYLRTRLPQPWPYGQTMYLSLAVSFAAFAAVVGGAQALVLRRHVPGAAWWGRGVAPGLYGWGGGACCNRPVAGGVGA